MSLLKNVIKGKINVPQFVLIFGPDGIGKSSFGAEAPNPIFLGTENGTSNLDVARFQAPKKFSDVLAAISELTNESHEYKTLVIDSLDWLEPIVWETVCADGGWKSIEDAGYGKGYVLALNKWLEMIKSLNHLRDVKKMNIVLIAHSQIKVFNDPSQPQSYDRYQLKLNDKAAALFREAVDVVLFATYETFVKKDGAAAKAKAFGDGKRVVFTERRPSFDAKNRMGLPFELPLSWDAFLEAQKKSNPDRILSLKQDIEDLISACEKADKKKLMQAAYKNAGDNQEKLNDVLNRIRVTLGGGN